VVKVVVNDQWLELEVCDAVPQRVLLQTVNVEQQTD
jgi:hypothetical protein